MDEKTYKKISEWERKQIETYKDNYIEYMNKKTNEELQKINKKTEDNGNCILIIAIMVFINLIISTISIGFITTLYEEFMPEECKCNNELIIDTDTMTL